MFLSQSLTNLLPLKQGMNCKYILSKSWNYQNFLFTVDQVVSSVSSIAQNISNLNGLAARVNDLGRQLELDVAELRTKISQSREEASRVRDILFIGDHIGCNILYQADISVRECPILCTDW